MFILIPLRASGLLEQEATAQEVGRRKTQGIFIDWGKT